MNWDWLNFSSVRKDITPLREEQERKIEVLSDKYGLLDVDHLLNILTHLKEEDRTGWSLNHFSGYNGNTWTLSKKSKRTI